MDRLRLLVIRSRSSRNYLTLTYLLIVSVHILRTNRLRSILVLIHIDTNLQVAYTGL